MKAADFGKPELLAFMRKHRYAVVSTCAADGAPQGALVGVATTDSMQLIFDTVSSSRKHQNLARDPRIAVTFCGPEEQTLQLGGLAYPVATKGPADSAYRDVYYLAWPDGRERLTWPDLSYWRISPRWARYSDFDRGPLIAEFRWDADADPPLTRPAHRK
jgi:general stress protein 26